MSKIAQDAKKDRRKWENDPMRQCLGLWRSLFLCQAAAGTSGSRASG